MSGICSRDDRTRRMRRGRQVGWSMIVEVLGDLHGGAGRPRHQ